MMSTGRRSGRCPSTTRRSGAHTASSTASKAATSTSVPSGKPVHQNTRHVVAVSANNLLGIYLKDRTAFAWLRDRRPTAVLGGSIYVFDLTGDADAVARVRGLTVAGRE